MRLVEGTDLRALLRDGGRARARPRARDLQPGRERARMRHTRKGLVHRDVKPSNVLLDANEHVYLADFGLTRRLEEQGAQAGEGRSVGTPAYLAPEQIEGGPVDGRADVYSLGCLLFECLTGESRSLRRTSRLAAAWAHLEEEPPSASELDSDLPEAIDAVIRKALAKDPDDRYPTCGALIAAAEEALGLRQRPHRSGGARLLLVAAAATRQWSLAAALAVALVTRDDGRRSSVPTVRENSLVRIDPATNAISAVVDVGQRPMAAAVGGQQRLGLQPMSTARSRRSTPRRTRSVRRRDVSAVARRPRPSHRPRARRRRGRRVDRRRRRQRQVSPHEGPLGRPREARLPPRPRAQSGRGRGRRGLGPRRGRSRQSGAARRPGHRRGDRADSLPRLLARSTSLDVGLGRVWVVSSSTADALPDQPSLGRRDGAHRPRATRRPTRGPVRHRLRRRVGRKRHTLVVDPRTLDIVAAQLVLPAGGRSTTSTMATARSG